MPPRRAPLRSVGLVALLGLSPSIGQAGALAVAPPNELEDPERRKAERSQVALGFDPTLAPAAKSDTVRELGLEPTEDGDLRYVDPLGRFSASFHPDGSVTFADPWRRSSGKNPERGVCCGRPPRFSFPNFNMSGPVEWLMYMTDQDPLRREKALLLERTREYRTRVAIEFARANIADALARLEGELQSIWSDESLTPAAKRALLFERWDECDERFNIAPPNLPDEALSVIDGERLTAAERARGQILTFISRRAAAGTAVAYSPEELAALNDRRVSREPFDPYTQADGTSPAAPSTPASQPASTPRDEP